MEREQLKKGNVVAWDQEKSVLRFFENVEATEPSPWPGSENIERGENFAGGIENFFAYVALLAGFGEKLQIKVLPPNEYGFRAQII